MMSSPTPVMGGCFPTMGTVGGGTVVSPPVIMPAEPKPTDKPADKPTDKPKEEPKKEEKKEE